MDVIFTAILDKDTHISVNDNLVQLIVDQKLVNKMLKKKKDERERHGHLPVCMCHEDAWIYTSHMKFVHVH